MPATSTTPWLKRVHRATRRLLWVALVLVVCALGVGRLALEYGDRTLRGFLVEQLSAHYKNLSITIRSVERLPGVGIEIRGLLIADAVSGPEPVRLLYVDELLVRCNTRWESLLQKQINIRQIRVRRPKLRAERRNDGTWNTTVLFDFSRFQGIKPVQLPPIIIEDGELELVHSGKSSLKLHRLHATCRQMDNTDGRPSFTFDASCASQSFDEASVKGRVAGQADEWTIAGEIKNLRISPSLSSCLPAEIAERLAPLAPLRAWSDLSLRVQSLRNRPLWYSVKGRLFDGTVNNEALPYSVTRLEAQFACDPTSLSITNATAQAGAAKLKLRVSRSGNSADSPLMLHAQTDQFPLDSSIPKILPENLKELWNRFAPSGVADMQLNLLLDGHRLKPDLLIQCRNLSFTYDRFPYRVHDASGTLHLKDGQLIIDLETPISGKTTRVKGQLHVLEQPVSGWVEIETDGAIPLDEALLRAMPAKQQELIRSLHPTGMMQVFGRFERNPGEDKFRKNFLVQLRGCSMRYDKFPYPIDRINGTLVVVNDTWSFEKLTGHISSGFIFAAGNWDPRDAHHQLKLDFQCSDVPLDESLRSALREDVRRTWAKLQPRGTIDHLDVHVRFNVGSPLDVEVFGQKWTPEQNVEGRTISLKPVWFPYRLDNVTGSFHYRNGTVTMENVQGEHGTTHLKKLSGVCERLPNGHWELTIDQIDVEQLELDEQLIAALPPRWSKALSRLQLVGKINADGWLKFRGATPNQIDSASWEVTTDMEDASLDCGTRLEHLRGNVRWSGEQRQGQTKVRGEMRFDSLTFRGMHITQVRGPLLIDEIQIAVGAWAQAEMLANGLPRTVTARAFGGEMTLEARLSLLDDARFALRWNLTDADLARVARETGTATASVSGKMFAALQLAGQTGRRESWRGGGTVRLFDADLYQLPAMIALLKLLNVQTPDSTAFTKADAAYLIEGDRIYFERIGLQGDAVSLIGSGDMGLQRQLNLEFHALVGREESQLPFFRPLFKEAARNVLLIKVTGTVEEPIFDPQPFPELNNTLQFLFPETPREPLPMPNFPPREADAPRRPGMR